MRLLGSGLLLTFCFIFSCNGAKTSALSMPAAHKGGESSIEGGGASGGQAPGGSASISLGGASVDSGGASGTAAGMVDAASGGGNGGSAGGALVGPPFGHPDPSVTAPKYDGFTLWVVEDFTQPLDLVHDPIWTYSDGGFETHRFTRDAITFEPGKMVLTLSDTKVASSCSYSNTGLVPARERKSGELRTKHNWFRYGRYEVRFKAPSVKPGDAVTNGNYIISLFTYRQPACQQWREIDLEVTGDSPNHLSTNLITGEKDCNFTPDKEQPQTFELPANFRTDFQTIGFEWLPGGIKFYYLDADLKAVTVRELTSAKVPDLSAKIMANLWVFGDSFDFGGPLGSNNVLPFRAEYDFIRFYKWDMDKDYPCADMSADCLRPDDVDLVSNNACDGIEASGDLAGCKQCGTTLRMACNDACQ